VFKKENAMFALILKSGWTRVSNWVVDWLLGSVVRASALNVDDDMCLLLRVEVPRGSCNTKAGSAPHQSGA
jgi:hypothetical protein